MSGRSGASRRSRARVRAFLDTDLDLYIHGGEGWKNYGALGAQVANTPEWGAELMDSHFDPVVLRLIELLKKAMPDCAEEDIFWSYHFVTGALDGHTRANRTHRQAVGRSLPVRGL